MGHPDPGELVDLHESLETLDGHRSQWLHVDVTLDQAQGFAGQKDGARTCDLLHSPRQVRRLADRGVVHVKIIADRTNDDLARVEPDPDLDGGITVALDLLTVSGDRFPHPEGRVTRAHR